MKRYVLALALAGSASLVHAQAPSAPVSWTFGPLTCVAWSADDLQAAGVGAAAPSTAGAERIEIVVHVMKATVKEPGTKPPYELLAWKDAWKVPVKLWTPADMRMFFGPDGLVNARWKPSIELRLARIEDCTYPPKILRLDDVERDSMFTPGTRVPWATQLFRSLNEVFIASDPRRLHVLLWWALEEDELGVGASSGYGRSAGRGGPGAWISTWRCLRPQPPPPTSGPTPPPAPPQARSTETDAECGRLIAHEVGHALTLQHVTKADVGDPEANLMHKDFLGQTLEDWQREQARAEARRRFRNFDHR